MPTRDAEDEVTEEQLVEFLADEFPGSANAEAPLPLALAISQNLLQYTPVVQGRMLHKARESN